MITFNTSSSSFTAGTTDTYSRPITVMCEYGYHYGHVYAHADTHTCMHAHTHTHAHNTHTGKWHYGHLVMTCPSFAVFSPQVVVISAVDEVPTAGNRYSLQCNISRAETLDSSILLEVVWLDSNNNIITSNPNISISEDTHSTGTMLSSILMFPRIRTSQGGRYSCTVNMTIPGIVDDHRVVMTVDVSVISKLMIYLYYIVMTIYLTLFLLGTVCSSSSHFSDSAAKQRCPSLCGHSTLTNL